MTRVPPHRSLIFRLLVASVTIAIAAIVATSWLAAQSTSQAIRQEIGQSLSDDKSVYDELLTYAATHTDWSGVQPLVADRARALGRRITLMTEKRRVIVDSAPGPSLELARPSALVDPLWVDLTLTGRTDHIDPRVVGPYRLTAKEQQRMRRQLDEALECVRTFGSEGVITTGPHGRPKLALTRMGKEPYLCTLVPDLTRSEQRPFETLRKLVAECAHEPAVTLTPDLVVTVVDRAKGVPIPDRTDRAAQCLQGARYTQLEPYVAPPALLFVTDPGDPAAQPVSPFSRPNLVRLGTATGIVLILAVLVTVVVGSRLVRPLRALTEAARRPTEHQRVPVTGKDEIGLLAVALNESTERRERSEQQRKAMVNDVAHELRNPLTNIRNWLEAAQDGLATIDGPLLTLLHDETVHLQHIVDDLRDLAAADAGSLRMHPEPMHLDDAIEQVLDAHRPGAAAAGVTLAMSFDGDPLVVADPVRLRQLVGNLLSNAIRHSERGGTVTVRASTDAGRLTITVADTGAGIAEADLPRVFDRFWRADESRTRSTGGSGLGLPIARKIAEAHGGGLTVQSTPGAGATFTATLTGS
ncbi:two-component sensor histidine kinase [Actinoplanes italicus]|uniref:histidine kinase n=1 Tax=Actinoplanes italicus TaxID=113567 RepID=A0A2T0JZ64_9ACTN|nr:HAMP domain-containing sensor histidine kinase [Actinoplanes italicus]PRX15785.1 two-component system sensor histidine kinase BaeS [Actinoplanes italicus]GIE28583.1 two-component sensor histidine kinase [Actinoplanes italicus]